jgi:hypothetical protein
LDDALSFNRGETPPPPTAPVNVSKLKNKQIDTLEPQEMPNTDQFDVAGDLEEDWFGDDNDNDNQLLGLTLKKQQSDDDDDDGFRGNPMVAGDEDVESVEYYSQKSMHTSPQDHVVVQNISDTEEDDDQQQQEEEQEEEHAYSHYQAPAFKSELNDVWSTGYRRMSGPQVVSESEDEDNVIHRVESPFSPSHNPTDAFDRVADDPSFNYDAYEEIGGNASGANPWSNEQIKQPWSNLTDNTTTAQQEHVEQQDVEQVYSKKKKKKKKSIKNNSLHVLF